MNSSVVTPFPVSLPPPAEPVTVLSRELLQAAVAASRQSPRRRMILPLHKDHGAPLQRMFNVVQPRSYLRPHRHASPPKAETLLVWQGAIAFFEFAAGGEPQRCEILRAGGPRFGVDIEPGVIHTFVALEPDTILLEAKAGPYERISDKDFAPWAPAEGAPEVAAFLDGLYQRAQAAEAAR
ncbi:MAG: WbuC family cupin fold metalloprotein [Verrucomicrobiae bacterium]|nr:WbuC family cupin fold metalloprotein [Verrucomicrobiae bacterium]